MKKSNFGTYFLIGGLFVVFLAVVATFVWATQTRSGALCVMIVKALGMTRAYVVASVAIVAGTSTAVYALSRLLSLSKENESNDGKNKIGENQDDQNQSDKNTNDEN